jgi:hypothetical protein
MLAYCFSYVSIVTLKWSQQSKYRFILSCFTIMQKFKALIQFKKNKKLWSFFKKTQWFLFLLNWIFSKCFFCINLCSIYNYCYIMGFFYEKLVFVEKNKMLWSDFVSSAKLLNTFHSLNYLILHYAILYLPIYLSKKNRK